MYPSRKDRLQIYNKRRMGRNMGTTQRSGHRDYHHKDQPHNLNLQTHVMSNIGCSSQEVPVTHSHLCKHLQRVPAPEEELCSSPGDLEKSLPGTYID